MWLHARHAICTNVQDCLERASIIMTTKPSRAIGITHLAVMPQSCVSWVLFIGVGVQKRLCHAAGCRYSEMQGQQYVVAAGRQCSSAPDAPPWEPFKGMVARAEYVPWAAFCNGVHCVRSLAFTSAPSLMSCVTVSRNPQPIECGTDRQGTAVKGT